MPKSVSNKATNTKVAGTPGSELRAVSKEMKIDDLSLFNLENLHYTNLTSFYFTPFRTLIIYTYKEYILKSFMIIYILKTYLDTHKVNKSVYLTIL